MGSMTWRELAYGGAVAMMMGCSDSEPAGPNPGPGPTPITVRITSPTDTLRSIGEQQSLVAKVTDEAGAPITDPTVIWSSAGTGTIGVASDGIVTARANGTARVVAAVGAAADTIELTVAQRAASIQIIGADTVFNPGVRTRFTATAEDALGNAYVLSELVWETANAGVATAQPGFVLPLKAGTTDVIVRAGDFSESHPFTVVDALPLGVSQALAEAFQWAMEDSASVNGAFGASAVIVIPDVGTWKGVYGYSDASTRIRPDMMFFAGSINKAINSAVLLSLVDAGTVSLDDTIGDWLPPFTNPNIPTGVTIQQMLQNTSGIFSFTTAPTWGDSVLADPARVWDPQETMEKFVLAPLFAPGTSWKASNSGYVLSAMIAETATGRTFAQQLRSRVFDPMGMVEVNTPFFEVPTAPIAATWQGPPGGPLESADGLRVPSIHTALFPQTILSADALAKFGQSLFGDFLSPALKAQMLDAVPDDGGIPGQIGGGIGIRKYNYLGRTQYGHSGSQGTGSGFLVWDEASGIIVAILYNQNGSSHFSSHFRLVPHLLQIALAAQ
jgi:D-alanyl-D-alanine carboxypeptidase